MEITLTLKGEDLELSKMLQSLGVALQGETKTSNGSQPELEAVVEPVKQRKPREKKAETLPPPEEAAAAEEKVPEEEPVTLESLRMEVVALAKVGKSNAIKAIFEEFGAQRLQDVKKEDYKAVAAQLGSL